MDYVVPLIVPIALSILMGLAISIPLIRVARRHGWFADRHIITRQQFESQLEDVFRGRSSLTSDEYYETYFMNLGVPKEIPIRIRRIFEEHFDTDFSRLTPDDDFSKDLSFFWDYDSMVDVELVLAIEEEFGIKISNKEAEGMKSIRKTVETVWKKKEFPTNR